MRSGAATGVFFSRHFCLDLRARIPVLLMFEFCSGAATHPLGLTFAKLNAFTLQRYDFGLFAFPCFIETVSQSFRRITLPFI